MESRRHSCRQCGLQLPAPTGAKAIYCPRCQRFTQFQPKNNMHGAPTVNANGPYSNNINAMNTGLPVYPAKPRTVTSGFGYGNYRPESFQIRSPQVMRPQPPPPVHGRKRAVLCGANYRGHNKSLKGSINDVLAMRYLLVDKLGFPNASVIVLTENEKDIFRIPTKANIRAALRWLVHSCQPGDSLVFHYSGHGSRVRDLDGDEIDGYDESLCPIDYETEGRILDDEINETIIRPLPRGATLHAIIDACHSGTFLDLQFMCRINRGGSYMWEDHRTPHGTYKGTRGGIAICISACDDHQSSGDTIAFTGFPTGALTYSFVKTLEQEPKLTYGRMLLSMHKKIHETQKRIGLNSKDVSQEPQLSASERFDIHSKLLIL